MKQSSSNSVQPLLPRKKSVHYNVVVTDQYGHPDGVKPNSSQQAIHLSDSGSPNKRLAHLQQQYGAPPGSAGAHRDGFHLNGYPPRGFNNTAGSGFNSHSSLSRQGRSMTADSGWSQRSQRSVFNSVRTPKAAAPENRYGAHWSRMPSSSIHSLPTADGLPGDELVNMKRPVPAHEMPVEKSKVTAEPLTVTLPYRHKQVGTWINRF